MKSRESKALAAEYQDAKLKAESAHSTIASGKRRGHVLHPGAMSGLVYSASRVLGGCRSQIHCWTPELRVWTGPALSHLDHLSTVQKVWERADF